MVSVLLAKEAKLDLFLKGVHFEIKGLCASAQPGVAFRRLCSQSVVLEGVGWGESFSGPTHKPFTWGPGLIFPRP